MGGVAARHERGGPDPAVAARLVARPRRRDRHLLRSVFLRAGGSPPLPVPPARVTAVEEPTRHNVSIGGRRLSCLDFGGHGQPLLALHGHFGEGSTFTRLARELGPDWQVIAPDQRGHGESERAEDFSRDGYVNDAAAVLDHFGGSRTPWCSATRSEASTRTSSPHRP
ncbi:alpha/beta fold hydrolase [Streptomyces aureoverticillatus]|uniref:alpha/beta fold hydrolase n=1 Tax=Streptomyces aureoverticillatus TaxID=66871 RepID=UPI00281200C6|nr:alpha/beta fold hydrolase [Streptomyces aureoverticillatus]